MATVVDATPLTIDVAVEGRRPSISVTGQANHLNITQVVSVLDRLADEEDRCVSLDLGGLEAIDLAALGSLAASANLFKDRRKRLRLSRASEAVHEILHKHLLSELFCVRLEHESACHPRACENAAAHLEIDVFSLPCVASSCREARERVGRVAESVGFSRCYRDDVMLAVGEAAANAVKHGKVEGDGHFTVSCLGTPDKVCASVSDNGPGFNLNDLPSFEDALFLEHGRGVHCMFALMDDVSFQFDGGTTVRMVKFEG